MEHYPEEFLEKMKKLLSMPEYEQFLSDCEKPPYRGIRINTLKCDIEKAKKHLPFMGERTPFSDKSFYIPNEISGVGEEPFHHAGAFYVQEPSAASAVTVLDVQKGDLVLDLCAAPGGKSTQIAAELEGTGLLWSNEYVKSRANILLSNIERMGIANAVVSNCHPDILCEALECYFDKVLVDAPCSGEGMFRKDKSALEEWTSEHSVSCGERQLAILESAAKAVKSGGVMVYSTCTFSTDENERVIEKFLALHDDFELIESGVNFGRSAMGKAVRIIPSDGGEGHFAAKLRKKGDWRPSLTQTVIREKFPEKDDVLEIYDKIFKTRVFGENFKKIGDKILILPEAEIPLTSGLNIIRAGILFGEVKKKRIEPCHALFMAARAEDLNNYIDLSYGDERLKRFYHGEEISVSVEEKGFTAVLVEGVSTGFGKASGGVLKNRYPKGLRNNK